MTTTQFDVELEKVGPNGQGQHTTAQLKRLMYDECRDYYHQVAITSPLYTSAHALSVFVFLLPFPSLCFMPVLL